MIPAHLRRKRTWSVDDFAEFLGTSHKSARATLHRYNAELGGRLLVPSRGRNRRWTFQPGLLATAIDDGRLAMASGLFTSIDALELRLDQVEEQVADLFQAQRVCMVQTGSNTREIAVLKRRTRAA